MASLHPSCMRLSPAHAAQLSLSLSLAPRVHQALPFGERGNGLCESVPRERNRVRACARVSLTPHSSLSQHRSKLRSLSTHNNMS